MGEDEPEGRTDPTRVSRGARRTEPERTGNGTGEGYGRPG